VEQRSAAKTKRLGKKAEGETNTARKRQVVGAGSKKRKIEILNRPSREKQKPSFAKKDIENSRRRPPKGLW